ncbi:O-methyltransferase [Zafaria sp. Z1313]|uniref:O-methyltransferase n=1 Tax=unclassified Zafaria TaxID=2828765 RepID=UPI002E78427C|nr:class I SAM-dependent methyltransferase [Zafaria sp. J156]MEE1620392.1 class I SAM-dependent methyltransferase [Zafaria sp. J156]
MSADKQSSWSYTEALSVEDEVLMRARDRGHELGVSPVGSGTAALLRVLAAASGARTAVEIGSGVGVSGVSLLRGLSTQSVFTTIDIDVDHLNAAREAFQEAGIAANRTRTICGRARDVLPRLTDGAYDLVFIDADKTHLVDYVEHGVRLLRRGGMLLVNDALDEDRVPQPAVRQAGTVAARQAARLLREREDLSTATVPTGTGLLIAVKDR